MLCGGPLDGHKFTVRTFPPDWRVPVPDDMDTMVNLDEPIRPIVPVEMVIYHLSGLITSDGYMLYMTDEVREQVRTAAARQADHALVHVQEENPHIFSWAKPARMSGKNPYPWDIIAQIDEVTE
jgi:hypothetical protein